MARLPTPGSDGGNWGDILNSFLGVAHNTDGSLGNNTVGTNQLQSGAVTNTQLDSVTQIAIAAIAAKYSKPGSGIPASDLVSGVQTSLTAANNAVPNGNSLGATGAAHAPSILLIAKFDGTDETTTLQNAMTAAAGGSLLFPANKIITCTQITPPSNVVLRAEGYGAGINLLDDGTNNSQNVYLSSVSNVTVDGLTIGQSNVTGRTGSYGLIRAKLCSNVTIRNCTFGASSSILVWLDQCTEVSITNNVGGQSYADGIHISRGSSFIDVIGNRISGVQDDMIAVNSIMADGATAYGPCTDINIIGNVCQSNSNDGNGIAVYGGNRITIVGNTVGNPVFNGIYLGNLPSGSQATYNWYDCTVSGNTVNMVNSTATPLYLTGVSGSSFSTGVTAVGNVLVPVAAGNRAIFCQNISDSSIVGNICDNKASNTLAGISINACYRLAVSSNIIQGSGVTSGSNSGIAVVNSCIEVNVNNNVISGVANALYESGSSNPTRYSQNSTYNVGQSIGGSPLATSVFRGNSFNPIASPTVTIPSSGTAVAAIYYDRDFYVTAGTSSCTMAIQSGATIVIPASTLALIRVPAGKTVTSTYSNAPTWVVEGL